VSARLPDSVAALAASVATVRDDGGIFVRASQIRGLLTFVEQVVPTTPAEIEILFGSLWQPIETAPQRRRILVWGGAPTRFALRDNLGNWRANYGGGYTVAPSLWLPEPLSPRALS
jgi:hypothetical protein